MSQPQKVTFVPAAAAEIATISTRIAVFMAPDGAMNTLTRKANTLMRGALKRLAQSELWEDLDIGKSVVIPMPDRMAAPEVMVVKSTKNPSVEKAREMGAAIAGFAKGKKLTVLLATQSRSENILYGLVLGAYIFDQHKSKQKERAAEILAMVNDVAAVKTRFAPLMAVAQGVYFTRDLVNEPANVLTTTEFANRLEALSRLGVKVEVLEEPALEKLGMGSLLCVGQGSESPSKVVVMQWQGGGKEAPFALVGKGVVFDTGGISLKPAAGMEDMTMDMGGAGVVSGVMQALASRKAAANVVGVVGLVENMPDGKATRPGDVVTSMKGDTIEVINTDAEGRLVLADVLWYTQERFKPKGMINLATLTGAILVALGHENAGAFSNDDTLCNAFLKAAAAENEGAWRMPLGKAYDKLIDTRMADMKNIGGRMAGSITAAQFLQRFVKEDTPWIHLDIAGVASPGPTPLSPKGATGWGVAALNRLIADNFEG
ncbi:MAG: leucyl aminopeptidase [Rhodobacteraceae bacterium]|nr:leucyl aminopeptidase [Paracoccaceae bacterium]